MDRNRYFLIIVLLTISILFHIDSLPNSSPSSSLFYSSSISPSSPSSFYHSPSVLSILLFILLPSCSIPHTCQLCLSALSKLEFFSLALRKIALSLKCFSHPFLLPPYSFSLHNREKDGDREEDNDEEVAKQVLKRRF
jgi:hypothetical protein